MTSQPTTSPDQWSVRRILEWTTGYLAEHGSESPRLEAEILLAHARGCPRIQLYTHYDDVLPKEVRSRMRELVKRRAAAEPVAYLVGHREFFSLDFEVTPDVFIPRPETELLVMEALERIKDREAPRVFDLGTGSGCIAVAIAVNAPKARVTAVDLSPEALPVARRNAQRHGVADRVTFLCGNLFTPLASEGPFDAIACNPPYVATTDEPRLQPDVRQHEPPSSLYAGEDGLDVMKRIVAGAPNHLKPGGCLLLEFSPEQAAALEALLAETGRFENVAVRSDLSRASRMISAHLKQS